ncbi:MAG TPA: PRC-barrel domain-containing protein [Propionibacteriaceae bacterium]|nr:PRC-barrel domain-containing protein [Propionibacteriaceae bacterium]
MSIRNEDVHLIATGSGEVRSATGDRIGEIGQIYLDNETGEPNWVTVKTGLFGTQESFVPLGQAEATGADITVPYDKETIKNAPRLDAGGSLNPEEERRLYSYYFSANTIQTSAVTDRDVDRGDYDRDVDRGDDDRGADRPDYDGGADRGDYDGGADRDMDRGVRRDEDDTARPSMRERIADALEPDRDRDDDDRRDATVGADRTDDDQVDTGTGGSRLRRYVVTEKVVPVSREEVPVDDDPDRR